MIIFAEAAKGGIATYLALLMRKQTDIFPKSQPPFYFVPNDDSYPKLDPAHAYQFQQQRGILQCLWLMFKLIQLLCLRRERYIFAHSTVAGFISVIVRCFSFGYIKVIYCAHGWSSSRQKHGLKKWLSFTLDRFIGHMCHSVINISHTEQQHAQQHRLARHNVHINNTLADLSEAQQQQLCQDKNAFPLRLLFIGRLDYQKGLDILLNALAQLPIQLTVIGDSVVDPQHGAQLKQRMQAMPHVDYHGWCSQTEILQHMAHSHCLVIPSRWEGFGLVAIEAFRANMPVLASRNGALAELVQHNHNGWLFELDSPTDLLQCLTNLTVEQCIIAGQHARNTFTQQYNLDDYCNKMQRILSNFCHNKPYDASMF